MYKQLLAATDVVYCLDDSSANNLIILSSSNLDVVGRMDVIYKTFYKGFDKVHHDILLQQLFDLDTSIESVVL